MAHVGVTEAADLPARNPVTLEENGTARRKVNALAASFPQGPQVAMECTSYPQVLAACKTGLVGVVPEIAQKQAKAMGLKVTPVPALAEESVSLSANWLSKHEERPQLQQVLSLLLPH